MALDTEYDPKYVALDDLPLSGPDQYTDGQKRRACFQAESSLELDVNEGEEIPSNEVVNAHKAAVLNLATHVLTHAAEEPSDVTLGDMESGGGTTTEYSSRYLDEYHRLVDLIVETLNTSSSDNWSMAVNTADDD